MFIFKIFHKIYYEVKVLFSNLFYDFYKIKIHVQSEDKTVDLIVNNKKSLARFGDGEFKWMWGLDQYSFQKNDLKLSKKLYEVLNGENDSLIIAVPKGLTDVSEYKKKAKKYWKLFTFENKSRLLNTLDLNKEYANTNITRCYMDYYSSKGVKERFDRLKRIWDNRNVVIVEGQYTKLGIGNDLFDNCKSIKRIICPATNAFDKYDDIVNAVKKCSKENLFLISLGPTATVLAYDMSLKGYQCIDTGHVDIEYMWFLNNAFEKIPVVGKYVNEANQSVVGELIDKDYDEQIIEKIL